MTKYLKYIIYITLASVCAVIIALSGTVLYITPKLPHVDILTDIKLQTPLRIYTNEGLLISEFGDKKRTPATIDSIPDPLKDAFLSAEDANFYDHSGISFTGLSRALIQAITQSQVQTGGSTITQQVAKNYFLTPERTIIRKIREMLLALEMEKSLSKDKILELYLNKIFLGHRAYGVAAAAQVYYGKDLDELTLAQNAMIAGLPKAPSSSNPLRNPERALTRRDWILSRMLKLGHITEIEYQTAISESLSATKHGTDIEAYAPYIAEMARQKAAKILGKSAINDGYNVYTTINANLQATADRSLKSGLETYTERHGYRSVEAHLDTLTAENKAALFAGIPTIGDLQSAIVIHINPNSIEFETADHAIHTLKWENGLSEARPYITEDQRGPSPKLASDVVNVGDLIRVRITHDDQWQLAQLPKVEGALIALDSKNGAIRALTGGYDFYKSKFNRAIQARRQMGSNMKPFVYTAAISRNLNAASIINDAPIVFHDNQLENAWRPTNDGGRFLGPIRLRVGLYRSRNLVSIRVLQQIGINYARNYVTRFGFEKSSLPRDLSLVLGSASFPPLQTAQAYAVFANQGYLVEPYLIQRIVDENGNVVYESNPTTACDNCLENNNLDDITNNLIGNLAKNNMIPASQDSAIDNTPPNYAPRVINKEDAFIMDSMLRDVIKKGTGWRAGKAIQRTDIGGKTGTTNGPTDLWFSGYHPDLVTVTWVGFDNNATLGNREYGGTVALPIWIDFMKEALEDLPVSPLKPPAGIVNVLIDTTSGKRAKPGQKGTMFEYFKESQAPSLEAESSHDDEIGVDDIF